MWGRNWTFHVECDESSISRRRVPYTTHETKVQFRPLAVYHIFHDTNTQSLFCLCKSRGIDFFQIFFFRIRIRIMTRIRLSLWNSFEKLFFTYWRYPPNLVLLRKVFVKINILLRIRIRIMILLWILIPVLHLIHRRYPPNFVWIR